MMMRRTRNNPMLERFFDDAVNQMTSTTTLALDVVERENEYIVSSPIPGVDPAAIEVKLDDDVLTISAEIHDERTDENERTLIRERRYGKFSRSLRFGLPVQGDSIEADYVNGILKVHIPKAEASQPKKINVKYTK